MGNLRNMVLWVAVLLLLVALIQAFSRPTSGTGAREIAFSEFLERVEQGQVKRVQIDGERIDGIEKNNDRFVTIQPPGGETLALEALSKTDASVAVEPQERSGLMATLYFWLPLVVLVGVWIFFLNRMQSGGRSAMGFGKSRAKLLTENTQRVTFDDVAGIDEAKDELQEIVEFLRAPQKYTALGGKIPKGALLDGPPGTGKTLLARAIAGEAGVPFFAISGSDFVEMFVGVGASRVRDMFEQAKKNAPCIVFIDEIDAVGRHRGAGHGGGNDEREQTLNQLLVEMDGFESNDGVIMIAATNRPDVLDPALLRPGRFDRRVSVPNPDINGRNKILQVHARKVPLAPDVELRLIARGTPGFSGADLANLVNEAALMAARANKRLVTMFDFEQAKDKVMMGAERRSMVLTDDQKRKTAYHEAGHAIVGINLPGGDPIYKATIIPRGRALGMVQPLPEEDVLSRSLEYFKSTIAMAMGGRVAEEILLGKDKVTTGPAGDIQQVTSMAKQMVTQYGMSEKVGLINYSDSREMFLGVQTSAAHVSPETQRLIDQEIHRIIDEGYETARRILTEKNDDFVRLAEALLEYETLTGEEIHRVIAGEKIDKSDDDMPSGAPASSIGVPKTRPGREPGGGMEPAPQG